MEKITKITSNLIILLYLKPRVKFSNAINSILENEIKRDKNKLLLFLIAILICVVILPLFIVYNQYPLLYRLKWALSFLLLFSILILFSSAYYDAKLRFNRNDDHTIKKGAALNFEFKNYIDHYTLASNLLDKGTFKCNIQDLNKILSNRLPTNQISITYIGANGRLSYHNLFFTFHYILENGIVDLSYANRKELLTYISFRFKKGTKPINLKTLNQNYNDWLKYKFHKSFENEFINEFVNFKQSVKD